MGHKDIKVLFEWMRSNPTWSKEIAAIDRLIEDNDKLFKLVNAQDERIDTLARAAADAHSDLNRTRDTLREYIELYEIARHECNNRDLGLAHARATIARLKEELEERYEATARMTREKLDLVEQRDKLAEELANAVTSRNAVMGLHDNQCKTARLLQEQVNKLAEDLAQEQQWRIEVVNDRDYQKFRIDDLLDTINTQTRQLHILRTKLDGVRSALDA